MSKIEDRLQELGLSLPTPPGKAGSYAPAKKFGGNLYFISGLSLIHIWTPRAFWKRQTISAT